MEKKNSLLIVDDDPLNLMELYHILRMEYNILTAVNGLSVLEKANEFMPDLILLDIIMPGMNGFEVITELKKTESTKSIPVIFITGLSDKNDEKEGMALGAADYICKPFAAETVKTKVREQIEIVNSRKK